MEKLDKFIIAGISVMTTNKKDQAMVDIPKLWERFYKSDIISKINNKIDDQVYAVYTDYEGDFLEPYRLIIGCAVSDDKQTMDGLLVKVIPALTYEAYKVSGAFPECLLQTWKKVWQSDLKRAYIADLEIYPQAFDPNNAKLSVYISVKP